MTLEHLRLRQLRPAIMAAALVVGAPAAHAFTMDTIANSNGSVKYVDPGDQLKDAGKAKTTDPDSNNGFKFSVGPSDRSMPGVRIGPPPDQSRFNDR
jgi:hypothetical protein